MGGEERLIEPPPTLAPGHARGVMSLFQSRGLLCLCFRVESRTSSVMASHSPSHRFFNVVFFFNAVAKLLAPASPTPEPQRLSSAKKCTRRDWRSSPLVTQSGPYDTDEADIDGAVRI